MTVRILKIIWTCAVLTLFAPPALAADKLPTALVYDDLFLKHFTGYDHPESANRLKLVMQGLEQAGLRKDLVPIKAVPVADKWITKVHTPQFWAFLNKQAEDVPTYLDPDTLLSEHSLPAAKLAAGGLLAAADEIMRGKVKNAFAAVRPPGHHATPDRAMGFCFINQVAVAARYVQEQHGIKRVLIVDWDVHHGNGTQDIFEADPSVFFFSTHQYPHYPGTGAADEVGVGLGKGTVLNVPLAHGAGDTEVIAAFREQLYPAMEKFKPEFIFISAGFDAHENDPLAGLNFTATGYAELTRIVMDIADKYAKGRVISMLEGGYGETALTKAVAAHVRTLMRQ